MSCIIFHLRGMIESRPPRGRPARLQGRDTSLSLVSDAGLPMPPTISNLLPTLSLCHTLCHTLAVPDTLSHPLLGTRLVPCYYLVLLQTEG